MTSTSRLILVTGATGKQGRAFISALRTLSATGNNGGDDFHVLALTRKTNSPQAKALEREKHVTLVEGDLDNPDSIKRIFEQAKSKGGIWGVFCVLAFPGLGANADGEEKQGKTLADVSLEYGVSLFVFSSSERGGESYDDKLTLDRLAKVRIERHLRELGSKGLPWTILRPGFFMENFEGLIGSVTLSVLRNGLNPLTTIQLIAVDDIGHVAAGVFKDPQMFSSQVLVVVGDIRTVKELEEAYKRATGHAMPSIPNFLARMLITLNTHTRGFLAEIERVHMMRTNPENTENAMQMEATRKAYPNMTTFETWAAKLKKGSLRRESNWNQVSLFKLFTGRM